MKTLIGVNRLIMAEQLIYDLGIHFAAETSNQRPVVAGPVRSYTGDSIERMSTVFFFFDFVVFRHGYSSYCTSD